MGLGGVDGDAERFLARIRARRAVPFVERGSPPALVQSLGRARILARNRALGGATSVPITVSAVLEKPATARVSIADADVFGPGLTHAVTTATATIAANPASALLIGGRVALGVRD